MHLDAFGCICAALALHLRCICGGEEALSDQLLELCIGLLARYRRGNVPHWSFFRWIWGPAGMMVGGHPCPFSSWPGTLGWGDSSGESGHDLNAGVDWPGEAFMGGDFPLLRFMYSVLRMYTSGKTEV
jgi:hypothetical protein